MPKKRIPDELQNWIDARRKYRLTHAQVQMARELGMNPRRFGKIANHRQEPWKLPLPQFIEECYRKRFGRDRPERVVSIEERAREIERKRAQRREAKRLRREAKAGAQPEADSGQDAGRGTPRSGMG